MVRTGPGCCVAVRHVALRGKLMVSLTFTYACNRAKRPFKIFGGIRTEGDAEKEGLRQTLQMLQRELGDQQALLIEVSEDTCHGSVMEVKSGQL